jgi:hypothetical protein
MEDDRISCPTCTFLNHAALDDCEVCGKCNGRTTVSVLCIPVAPSPNSNGRRGRRESMCMQKTTASRALPALSSTTLPWMTAKYAVTLWRSEVVGRRAAAAKTSSASCRSMTTSRMSLNRWHRPARLQPISCPTCTFLNHAALDDCEVCGNPMAE